MLKKVPKFALAVGVAAGVVCVAADAIKEKLTEIAPETGPEPGPAPVPPEPPIEDVPKFNVGALCTANRAQRFMCDGICSLCDYWDGEFEFNENAVGNHIDFAGFDDPISGDNIKRDADKEFGKKPGGWPDPFGFEHWNSDKGPRGFEAKFHSEPKGFGVDPDDISNVYEDIKKTLDNVKSDLSATVEYIKTAKEAFYDGIKNANTTEDKKENAPENAFKAQDKDQKDHFCPAEPEMETPETKKVNIYQDEDCIIFTSENIDPDDEDEGPIGVFDDENPEFDVPDPFDDDEDDMEFGENPFI
jgi:hypothetical protein